MWFGHLTHTMSTTSGLKDGIEWDLILMGACFDRSIDSLLFRRFYRLINDNRVQLIAQKLITTTARLVCANDYDLSVSV
jgi:hypothetical protein